MASIAEATRYIPNFYPPFKMKEGSYPDSSEAKALLEKGRGWLRENIIKYQTEYPPETTLPPSNDPRKKSRDPDIYIGAGGNAYVHWKLSRYYETEGDRDKSIEHLVKGIESIHTALGMKEGGKGVAFYIGRPGLFTLAALLYNYYNEPIKTESYVTHVLSSLPSALSHDTPDELLFGRAGYLSCLLMIKKHIDSDLCQRMNIDSIARQIFDAILISGQKEKKKYLYYQFYGADCLGAAHGTAGILYILLHCPHDWLNEPNVKPWLIKTIDHLVSTQLPNGNFPTKDSGKREGTLVHWCHGAPGIVPLLHRAHTLFGKKEYLTSMSKGLKCIWEYGLLRKGNGVCHGITGNAYTFLYLYRLTNNNEYYYKAIMMAQSVWSERIQEEIKTYRDPQRFKTGEPDHPLSLMEGLGGQLCFFADLLRPENTSFPGYDFN